MKLVALPLIAMLALLGCSGDVVGPQGAADEVAAPQSQSQAGADRDPCSENPAEILEGSVAANPPDAEDWCSLLSP